MKFREYEKSDSILGEFNTNLNELQQLEFEIGKFGDDENLFENLDLYREFLGMGDIRGGIASAGRAIAGGIKGGFSGAAHGAVSNARNFAMRGTKAAIEAEKGRSALSRNVDAAGEKATNFALDQFKSAWEGIVSEFRSKLPEKVQSTFDEKVNEVDTTSKEGLLESVKKLAGKGVSALGKVIRILGRILQGIAGFIPLVGGLLTRALARADQIFLILSDLARPLYYGFVWMFSTSQDPERYDKDNFVGKELTNRGNWWTAGAYKAKGGYPIMMLSKVLIAVIMTQVLMTMVTGGGVNLIYAGAGVITIIKLMPYIFQLIWKLLSGGVVGFLKGIKKGSKEGWDYEPPKDNPEMTNSGGPPSEPTELRKGAKAGEKVNPYLAV